MRVNKDAQKTLRAVHVSIAVLVMVMGWAYAGAVPAQSRLPSSGKKADVGYASDSSEKNSPLESSSQDQDKVKANQAKVILREFTQAQAEEKKALEHLEQGSLKELKYSQKTKLAQWEASEKLARHAFFKDHQTGPERRAYIQDFLKRREQLNHQLHTEKEDLKKSFQERLDALKKTHEAHLSQAKAMLDSGVRPSADLWPQKMH